MWVDRRCASVSLFLEYSASLTMHRSDCPDHQSTLAFQTVFVMNMPASVLPATLSDAHDVMRMPRSNVHERKHRQRVPIDDPAVIAAGVTERDETDDEHMLRDVVRYVRKQLRATAYASMAPALTRNSSRM